MAAIDSISFDLKHDIKTRLSITDKEFAQIKDVFIQIKKVIEKNYLAHLKAAIEDAVNEKKKNEIIQDLHSRKEEIGVDNCETIERMIKLKQFRPFTIILTPIVSKKRASTRIINKSALISYDPRIEIRQLRVFLAHEFGHIVLKELINEKTVLNDQRTANLFAFLAMLDKDDFYKNDCNDLVHRSPEELLSVVSDLC